MKGAACAAKHPPHLLDTSGAASSCTEQRRVQGDACADTRTRAGHSLIRAEEGTDNAVPSPWVANRVAAQKSGFSATGM
jgi:hypothetical protein